MGLSNHYHILYMDSGTSKYTRSERRQLDNSVSETQNLPGYNSRTRVDCDVGAEAKITRQESCSPVQ
jgi:hypothetical protein